MSAAVVPVAAAVHDWPLFVLWRMSPAAPTTRFMFENIGKPNRSSLRPLATGTHVPPSAVPRRIVPASPTIVAVNTPLTAFRRAVVPLVIFDHVSPVSVLRR